MNKFIELPASKKSLARRKRVCGKGINDAWYIVQPMGADGKQTMCPYYQKWHNMIRRCYDPVSLKKRPTYIGCTVCKEWLTFSVFRKWMEQENWIGLELDKDIICIGNGVYAPEFCCFTTPQQNNLLTDHRNAQGPYPQGVSFNKEKGKFVASCRVNGKQKNLGYTDSCHRAEAIYLNFKRDLIIKVARASQDSRIKNGLLRHADFLVNNPV